ncbi:MAG: aspartate kinase [Spirulinaceae cyanobacterium RM2_2_10]|nr:aspartate kinase [Spirulinaceae cyanobacterium SM2_1_0]NJO20398.1 aspartate kinase [Spirulinaceae cyanobacterium RM2_2_10]
MALIVQKYGGTSVGSVERIQAVAERIRRTVRQGNAVAVVVSAMGKSTDQLVNLAQQVTANPSRREMDMLLSTGEQVSIALLSMALHERGQPAISLTGAQVGIVTEAAHSRARILHIKTERLECHLNEGKVVVVAGFQGITDSAQPDITTLGRGGSDTSAVALAAALRASCCEIYTDVPGILTTDPRIVPEARLLDEITADEMLELASLGAKVLHPRAVEIARNYGVPLVVRSSWTDEPGTRVFCTTPPERSLENLEIAKAVDGVSVDPDQAKIALLRVPDQPGIAARLFGELGRQLVDIDLIVQSIHEGNSNDIAFTVVRAASSAAEAVAAAIAPVLRSSPAPHSDEAEVTVNQDIIKVAITGAGMIGRPGIAAQMFDALATAGINIQMISTSEVQVSCVIATADADRAIAALCDRFEVDASTTFQPDDLTFGDYPPVRGVALDRSQARLGIRQVRDRPGLAAKIFNQLAAAGISVDAIIQSQRCRSINGQLTRDIACTVAASEAERARTLLQAEAAGSWGEVSIDCDIAKVSAVGIGMIGRPGVAARIFRALAEQGINIQMIATSEIKVTCVVAKADGETALRAIHAAFELERPESIQATA